MNVLIIGSLPPPIGGTALTLESLKNQLGLNRNLHISTIDTVGIRGNGVKVPFQIVALLLRCVVEIPKADIVSLHIATSALPTVGFSLALLCKFLNRPFILRKFASTDYNAGGIRGLLNQYAIRMADLFLVETVALAEASQKRGFLNTRWFPTHRDTPLKPISNTSSRAKRFVFVGHVREYKGIRELVDASNLLGNSDIEIDVYGPMFSPFTSQEIETPILKYKGILDPDKVMTTLQQYDALILPTKAPTEGYPGAVVEALIVGLPVISTRCGAIPELVGENCGILLPFAEPVAIANAIMELRNDSSRYATLKQNVVNRANNLSTAHWADVFRTYCEHILLKNPIPHSKDGRL